MYQSCRCRTQTLAASKSLTENRLLERGIQLEFLAGKGARQASTGEGSTDDGDDDSDESDSDDIANGDAATLQALRELTGDITAALPQWVSEPDVLELVQNKLERMQITNKLCKHFKTQFGRDFQGITLGNNSEELNRM